MAETALEYATTRAKAKLIAWRDQEQSFGGAAPENVTMMAQVAQAQALDRIALAMEVIQVGLERSEAYLRNIDGRLEQLVESGDRLR